MLAWSRSLDLAFRVSPVTGRSGRHSPESVFDFVQGITALARGRAHQDVRLEFEGRAKLLMAQAA